MTVLTVSWDVSGGDLLLLLLCGIVHLLAGMLIQNPSILSNWVGLVARLGVVSVRGGGGGSVSSGVGHFE